MAENESVLDGKKALVVGGTSSVGLAVAKALLRCGALVTVTGRTWNPGEDEKDISFCRADFEESLALGKGCSEWFSDSVLPEKARNADVLAVCYGPFVYKKLHQTGASDWERLALCDYALPGMLVSLVLPGMMERKFGRILLFGGTRTDSVKNYSNNAAYAGAKTGISVIIKSVSAEYGKYGITCNGLMPGFTRNAPAGTSCISPEVLAEHALYLFGHPELNGVLMNVDRGWVP